MAAGTSFIIASACVFNNYIDRDIDAKMKRTNKRALVEGDIRECNALVFGAVIGLIGLITLLLWTNWLTAILGIIGFVSYVFAYTFSKRITVHSTLIGSISGSTPIAAGYTAAAGMFDAGAGILFVIMAIWQMPHFYAIGMFRRDDYAAAGIPILAVRKGMKASKVQITAYIALFVASVIALGIFSHASISFVIIMTLLSLYWLRSAISGFKKHTDDNRWARQLFGQSLYILLALSLLLAVDIWLP